MSQEVVDEMGRTSHEPTSRRITVEAESGATKKLKYNVPISGTEKADRSFLIEYQLPGSTSKLPQKKFIINTFYAVIGKVQNDILYIRYRNSSKIDTAE